MCSRRCRKAALNLYRNNWKAATARRYEYKWFDIVDEFTAPANILPIKAAALRLRFNNVAVNGNSLIFQQYELAPPPPGAKLNTIFSKQLKVKAALDSD